MTTIKGPRVQFCLENYLAWDCGFDPSEAYETLLAMSHAATRSQRQIEYARHNPDDAHKMSIVHTLHEERLAELAAHGLLSVVQS